MTECQRIIDSGFLKEDFFSEEVRDEYRINSEIKKVWAIELDLLRVLIDLCDRYNLRYWVGFGTLLGAVRHKGFIPWDDDLDVWMPREDYDKLLEIPNEEINYPYFLQTTLNDNDYYCAFARLRNSNTTAVLVSGKNHCNNGIYIDIYPIDGQLTDSKKQQKISRHIYGLNVATHAYMYNINPRIVTRFLHRILRLPFISYDHRKVYQKVNNLAKKVSWKEAKKVGIVVFWAYPFERTSFYKDDFEESLCIDFENLKVAIPKGYDRILKILYGDYMKYPPKEDRGLWHNFTFNPDKPYDAMIVG